MIVSAAATRIAMVASELPSTIHDGRATTASWAAVNWLVGHRLPVLVVAQRIQVHHVDAE
jgi:hypothetical protein